MIAKKLAFDDRIGQLRARPKLRKGRLLAGLSWLLLWQPGPARAAADLTPGDIQQIARFDRAPSLRDTPAWARGSYYLRSPWKARPVQLSSWADKR